jgi:hypothetical protein
MKIVPLVLTVLLAAGPALALNDDDRSLMVIDAGRLGVMMDQSERILNVTADPESTSTETFAVLKDAVRSYRRLVGVACAQHKADAQLCDTALYSPQWLNQSAEPSPEVLRSRIDEAQDHVAPLWNALCATLPQDHDPSLCQVE